MAYFGGYPANYGYSPYFQQAQQQLQGAQMSPANQQIQQSGFVMVRSEDEARNYPVAPGNSIYFKIENQPVLYVKTMGFNQLEGPSFERYRMEKDDARPVEKSVDNGDNVEYATKAELNSLRGEISAIKMRMAKKSKLMEENSDE